MRSAGVTDRSLTGAYNHFHLIAIGAIDCHKRSYCTAISRIYENTSRKQLNSGIYLKYSDPTVEFTVADKFAKHHYQMEYLN